MNSSRHPSESESTAWMVGDLKQALADIPDNLPLVAWVAIKAGDRRTIDQVVVAAGYGQINEGNGWHEDRSVFGLELEFPHDPPR